MKRKTFLFFLLLACLGGHAQTISVKSFLLVPEDQATMASNAEYSNPNGEESALIRVITTENGFIFDGGTYGILPSKQRTGEILLWVPKGLRKITVLHQQYGALRDYQFPAALEPNRVYRMELEVGSGNSANTPIVTSTAEVTIKVDADAEIWVNEEMKGIRTWQGSLPYGTYQIECRQASHESSQTTQKIDASTNGKTIFLLAPRPIYSSLSVETTPSGAQLFVDGKLIGETPKFMSEVLIGEHELRLVKDGYITIVETITIEKNDRMQVHAELTELPKENNEITDNQQQKKREKKPRTGFSKRTKPFFVTANLGVASMPKVSFGFTVGRVENFGWFLSVMTNGSFKGMSAVGQCDADGFLEGGYLPMYSGKAAKNRLSVMAGGIARLTDIIDARVGLGYGISNLSWETVDGEYYRNTACSVKGIEASAGVQVHLKGALVSLEAVTTAFKTLEGRLGVGFEF